jgi:hypothetical protein
MFLIYGVDPAEFEPSPAALIRFTHPEDRPLCECVGSRRVSRSVANVNPLTR